VGGRFALGLRGQHRLAHNIQQLPVALKICSQFNLPPLDVLVEELTVWAAAGFKDTLLRWK